MMNIVPFILLAGLAGTAAGQTASELYHDKDVGCADSQCHTASFQSQGGDLFDSTESLSAYIQKYMPDGEPELCVGTCANKLAKWLTPQLVGDPQSIAADFYDQFSLEPYQTTYRRAALLFTGQLPSPNAQPMINSEASLRSALTELTQHSNFGTFLKLAANDQLLTRRWRVDGADIIEPLYLPEFGEKFERLDEKTETLRIKFEKKCGPNCDYDALEEGTAKRSLQKHFDRYIAAEEELGTLTEAISEGIAEQPLELIRHVVENDLPYGQVLTADYLMMNPPLADLFGSRIQFNDPNNSREWRVGHIEGFIQELDEEMQEELGMERSFYPDKLPAAGVLTTPGYLARYPSTDTNRNRARARWTYYFFLGVDIEGIANRPLTNSDLTDSDNPTLNNPSCAMCHRIMDPVAATFQHWGNTWTYKERLSLDALPESYVDAEQPSNYQQGDQWYRDMRRAGFNGLNMPVDQPYGQVTGFQDGVQWLATEMVQDPRFNSGTVKFWWPAVMSRPLLNNPTKKLSYTTAELNAYRAQLHTVSTLAETFEQGNQNLRALLVDMVMSNEFRRNTPRTNPNHVTHVGMGRLLTPEQLKHKYESLLATPLTGDQKEEFDEMFELANISLGGIDSFSISKRSRALSPVMLQMNEALALKMSCSMVLNDLRRPETERLLFKHVDDSVTPTNTTSTHLIAQNISHLYRYLLGDSPSPKATRDLMQLFQHSLKTRTRLQKNAPEDWGEWVSYENEYESDGTWNEACHIPYDVDWENINWDSPSDIRQNVGAANNSNHTVRAWSLIMAALLTDPMFIYQ